MNWPKSQKALVREQNVRPFPEGERESLWAWENPKEGKGRRTTEQGSLHLEKDPGGGPQNCGLWEDPNHLRVRRQRWSDQGLLQLPKDDFPKLCETIA